MELASAGEKQAVLSVSEREPELITILEGPTPEFRPSPYLLLQSVFEGPDDSDVLMCELRVLNGEDIVERCKAAWRQHRPVQLDYPDELRMRQRIDVIAMRLQHLDEGPMLQIWVSQPLDLLEEEEMDDGDDDLGL
jgi:hypothetical protein